MGGGDWGLNSYHHAGGSDEGHVRHVFCALSSKGLRVDTSMREERRGEGEGESEGESEGEVAID